jgi:hypothetical protein
MKKIIILFVFFISINIAFSQIKIDDIKESAEYIEIIKPSEGFEPSEGSATKIYNTLGECVMTVGIQNFEPLQRIDISHLPVGIYFIQIGNYSQKFMVVK